MNLTPREKDKLLVSVAAMVARGRLQRGVKLNYPEAIALITDFVVEGAQGGEECFKPACVWLRFLAAIERQWAPGKEHGFRRARRFLQALCRLQTIPNAGVEG